MQSRTKNPVKEVSNPPNPWHSTQVELLGPPPEARLQIYEDASRTLVSSNDSPDIPFKWSVNPYRGCYHGCAYCYARPGHEYLDMGAGTDFERKIVVKPRAPELLRKCFEQKSWKGELIVFSGVTDCYQPIEASYELTRRCLEVCLEFKNPVSIITRSALVERDRELLAELHRAAYCTVGISVPFFDAQNARAVEPHAPSPARRFKTISRLAEAGVPVGVNVAPIIPGLTDPDIPHILRAAKDAGAQWAWKILLRLPGPVATVFEERMLQAFPMRAKKIMNQLNACREGKINESRFGHRMSGVGQRWTIIESLFDTFHRKMGFEGMPVMPEPSPFQPRNPQLALL